MLETWSKLSNNSLREKFEHNTLLCNTLMLNSEIGEKILESIFKSKNIDWKEGFQKKQLTIR